MDGFICTFYARCVQSESAALSGEDHEIQCVAYIHKALPCCVTSSVESFSSTRRAASHGTIWGFLPYLRARGRTRKTAGEIRYGLDVDAPQTKGRKLTVRNLRVISQVVPEEGTAAPKAYTQVSPAPPPAHVTRADPGPARVPQVVRWTQVQVETRHPRSLHVIGCVSQG